MAALAHTPFSHNNDTTTKRKTLILVPVSPVNGVGYVRQKVNNSRCAGIRRSRNVTASEQLKTKLY